MKMMQIKPSLRGRPHLFLYKLFNSGVPSNARRLSAVPSTIESIYSRKSPVEHVLLRPGMYVGSTTSRLDPNQYVPIISHSANADEGSAAGSIAMEISEDALVNSPACVKIFDEILVNAADNIQRSSDTSKLHVDIDVASNTISVCNDGGTIPVQVHKDEHMYLPELLFGNLLTGSNFEDNTGSTAGGRHGYGAKVRACVFFFFKLAHRHSWNYYFFWP